MGSLISIESADCQRMRPVSSPTMPSVATSSVPPFHSSSPPIMSPVMSLKPGGEVGLLEIMPCRAPDMPEATQPRTLGRKRRFLVQSSRVACAACAKRSTSLNSSSSNERLPDWW
jgi:hypothetical protein